MASSFGSDEFSDEFAMFAAIFRSPFEKTMAVTLSFMSEDRPKSTNLNMYTKILMYLQIFISCPDLDVFAQILM